MMESSVKTILGNFFNGGTVLLDGNLIKKVNYNE